MSDFLVALQVQRYDAVFLFLLKCCWQSQRTRSPGGQPGGQAESLLGTAFTWSHFGQVLPVFSGVPFFAAAGGWLRVILKKGIVEVEAFFFPLQRYKILYLPLQDLFQKRWSYLQRFSFMRCVRCGAVLWEVLCMPAGKQAVV